jgi:hypothetical protein
MTTLTKPPGCKVVRQYHSGGEQVYELESAEASLELRISSRSLGPGSRSWHVGAQLGNAPDSAVIADSAETKRAALEQVGAQWDEQRIDLSLPSVDWAAVAAALLAVRGI